VADEETAPIRGTGETSHGASNAYALVFGSLLLLGRSDSYRSCSWLPGRFPIPVVSPSYADVYDAAALVTFADVEVEAAECPCATPALSAHRMGADR
jgi:hypothetical protein